MKHTLNKLSKANKSSQVKSMEENMQPKNTSLNMIIDKQSNKAQSKMSFRKSIIVLSMLGIEFVASSNSDRSSPSNSYTASVTTSVLSSLVSSSVNTANNTPQKKYVSREKLSEDMIPNLPFANLPFANFASENIGSENAPLLSEALLSQDYNNTQYNNMQNLFNAADDERESDDGYDADDEYESDDGSNDEKMILKTSAEVKNNSLPKKIDERYAFEGIAKVLENSNYYTSHINAANDSMQNSGTNSLITTPGTVSKPRQRNDHSAIEYIASAVTANRRVHFNDDNFSVENTPERQSNQNINSQYIEDRSTPDNTNWRSNQNFRPSAAAVSEYTYNQQSKDSPTKETIKASYIDNDSTPENQIELSDYTPSPQSRQNSQNAEPVTAESKPNTFDGLSRAIATSFDGPVYYPQSPEEMQRLINDAYNPDISVRALFTDNTMMLSSQNNTPAHTLPTTGVFQNNIPTQSATTFTSVVSADMDDFDYAGFYGDVIWNAHINTNNYDTISNIQNTNNIYSTISDTVNNTDHEMHRATATSFDDQDQHDSSAQEIENLINNHHSDIANGNDDLDDDMPTGNMSNVVRYNHSNVGPLSQVNELDADINENDTYSERDGQTATQPTAVLNHSPNTNNEFSNTEVKKNVSDKSDMQTDLSL